MFDKGSFESSIVPPEIIQQALAEPAARPVFVSAEALPVPQSTVQERSGNGVRDMLSRVAATVALGTCLFMGAEQNATAAPTEVMSTAQPQPEQNPLLLYGGLAAGFLGLIASTTLGAVTRRRQTQENTRKEFNTAGREASKATRVSELQPLNAYAERRDYAPEVFDLSRTILLDRRGELETLRRDFKGDAAALEHEVRTRRNTARQVVNLFIKTLPVARKEMHGPSITHRIKRWRGKDNMYNLEKKTGSAPLSPEELLLNAKGANFDDLRDIKRVDLSHINLTGAGFQNTRLVLVDFTGSRLVETQLKGSVLRACSLAGADLRAAYLDGATIMNCVVDKNTKFGNLPDEHIDARHENLKPEAPDEYRGTPRAVLKNLVPDDGMTRGDVIELVHGWQRNGLKLLEGSDRDYFLNPVDDPTHPDHFGVQIPLW